MAYGSDPLNNPVDEVRLLVGDTAVPELLSDAEYEYFLSISEGSVILAAVLAAEAIAAKYARQVDEVTGPLARKCSQKSKAYLDLAASLRKRKAIDSAPIPYLGGSSISDVNARRANPDRVPPVFDLGETDSVFNPFSYNIGDVDDGGTPVPTPDQIEE